MKLPSREELHEYTTAIAIGGAKGAVFGLGLSGVGTYYVRHFHSSMLKRSTFFKTFAFMAPVLLCGVTSMEYASRDFEKRVYAPELIAEEMRRKQELRKLSYSQQLKHYCVENKYKIIMTGWAGSLAGSFWLINRDKYMNRAQKIVQARMYAQGLTVFLLLASMMLTTVSTGEERRLHKEMEDQEEWQKIVALEEKRMEQNHEPLRG
ncbi:respiratory supercomplex factor 2, mitochondrial [Trichomonascus vanleenenianus]|uniref:Rcf2p n=1 Tax=Trichomonascus vanleenenianus TaxID=2268995 RepID=UPI003ECB53D1